jgi:hypothetical protein
VATQAQNGLTGQNGVHGQAVEAKFYLNPFQMLNGSENRNSFPPLIDAFSVMRKRVLQKPETAIRKTCQLTCKAWRTACSEQQSCAADFTGPLAVSFNGNGVYTASMIRQGMIPLQKPSTSTGTRNFMGTSHWHPGAKALNHRTSAHPLPGYSALK